MKTKNLLFIAVLTAFTALAITGMAQETNIVASTNALPPVVAATNAPAVDLLPPGFEQIVKLLPAEATAFTVKAIVWIGSLSILFGLWGNRLGTWLRRRINLVAENNDAGLGTDAWLAKLFDNPIYKFLATLLRFVSISLPTIQDLNHALEMQRQAVADSKGK